MPAFTPEFWGNSSDCGQKRHSHLFKTKCTCPVTTKICKSKFCLLLTMQERTILITFYKSAPGLQNHRIACNIHYIPARYDATFIIHFQERLSSCTALHQYIASMVTLGNSNIFAWAEFYEMTFECPFLSFKALPCSQGIEIVFFHFQKNNYNNLEFKRVARKTSLLDPFSAF